MPSHNPKPPSLPLFKPHEGREGEAKDPHYRATLPPVPQTPPDVPVQINLYDKLMLNILLRQWGRRPNHENYSSISKFLTISKPALAGAHRDHHSKFFPALDSRRLLYLPLPPLICPALLLVSPPLQVTLSIQGGGEGHVVEGSRDSVGPRVWCHAGDAVLRLVWRELPPQLISCDVVLVETGSKEFTAKALNDIRLKEMKNCY